MLTKDSKFVCFMLAVIRRKRIHEGREDYPGLHRHRQQDGLAKVLEFRFLNLKESRHGGTLFVWAFNCPRPR